MVEYREAVYRPSWPNGPGRQEGRGNLIKQEIYAYTLRYAKNAPRNDNYTFVFSFALNSRNC